VQIFRVIVRGRFGPLDDARRDELRAELDGDELASHRFTSTGTLTYDRRLDFFSVRVEVRIDDEQDAPAAAFRRAEELAVAQLTQRDLPYRDLRTTGSNMADVWR
jgi:Family of unknown function (DUF6204)